MTSLACRIRIGFAVCLSGTAVPAFAQDNACGNAATDPQIFSVAITAPESLSLGTPQGYNPGRGRLTRQGIEYISGNSVRLEVITDRCTFIRQVRVGAVVLPDDQYSTINFHASAASPQPPDPQRFAHLVWLFLPPLGAGADDVISITVGRVQGNGNAVRNLSIARVTAVETNNTPATISISGSEIFNLLARSNYEFFGPTNSAIVLINGSRRRLYNYDPSSLQVEVTGNGISFGFKFKYEATGCDPTVRAYGEFRLRTTPGGLEIDWVNGPAASADLPLACHIPRLIPLIGLAVDQYVRSRLNDAPDSIRSRIEAVVGAFIGTAATGPARFSGSSTHTDELRIGVIVPAPSVTLQVPYDAFTLPGNTTAFPPGETLLLTASGLGMNDRAASGHGTVSSDPNGLPLAASANWPAARAVARSGRLPNAADPVGRLLVRPVPLEAINATAVSTSSYEPGCTVATPVRVLRGLPRLRFGVNDTADDSSRLRNIGANGYRLRVFFANDLPGRPQLQSCDRTTSNGRGAVER